MAAQVEVQTGEVVGRTGVGGRLHLSPLTDSSNKSLTEGPSNIHGSLIITPEPSKPAPSPKPRLTPKPFAVEKNPTIRPILAPKPQPKPRPESTRHLSYKPDPPSILKPQQPNVGVTSKPRPVLTNPSRPAPTSFKPSPKLNTGQTTKPVAQPFKPAPPLPIGDSSKPTPPKPAERQKPIAVGVSFFRSPTKPPAAEWSGSTKKEAEKDNVGSGSRLGASTMTRAKSMGFLSQIGQAEEVMKEEEKKVTPTVALRPQSKGSRPRPVSAIFLPSPTQTESSAPPWVGRRPLSADLTSRFESIGLSLHRKPPNGDSKENTPEEGAPLRRREREKAPEMTLPIPQGSDGAAAKPAVSDSGNERGKEGTEKEKVEEKSGGSSIKRRISLLLDSSSPLMGVTGPGSEPRSPVQPISEAEVPLAGVKQRIRQLTVDIPPTQNPVVKPTPRPRPLALDLTKRFTPERSTDLGSPLLSEATDHHDSASDPQSRVEASAASSSDQTKMTDDNVRAQEQLTATSPSPVAGSSDEGRSISKERESGSEVQTVRASLFENVVERHSVQVLADDLPKDKGSALLRSLSVKQRDNEDDGTLVTATYREPVSPSSPMRVMHSFDTVPAVEGSRAVSESVPSAYLEDKAMTLRSRRSEGNRPPAVDRTPPVQGDTGLAPTPGQPPRYLRVGALPKWDASGPEQEVDMEKGRQRELEKERQLALERQREAERQRDAEREEAAAAPKRLKMLEADEQPKPRATYFALTGQIQEPASPVDVGNTPVLFDDVPARSGQWGSQGKIVPLRRNPSLDEAFGKTLQSPYQVEEPMERSQVSETERGSMRDKHMAGEAMEVEKQRDSRTETDSQREKKKELEREKQRQVDVERQKHLEFARMKERERQREFERQRQKEYEKEKQREERQLERERQLQLEKERQRDLERQTLLEMEKRRQQELERERQREQESERRLEKERLLQLEKERQCDLERQTLLEMEKRRQQELERERQREQESERQRQLEKERQLQLEKERQRDLERQKLLEMEERRQQELERERRREQESERQRQLEKERQKQVEIERERQKELERERQLEKERQRELERQREAERERRELDRQREIEKETQRELERQQELEKERRREMEKERQREMEKERQREMEKERQRELERQREVEKERQREMEKERQREMEKERQKELEKERKREVERQRELDKERRLLEMQRERQRSEELERIKEMERRQLQEFERQKKQMEMERRQQELEKQRLREKKEMEEADKLRQMALQLEAERLREAEQERVKELEKEQQRELERQRQRDLVRQKKLDFERREMENQNMRQLELEKERRRKEELDRIKEMERRQLLEFEKQKQAERMQLAEVEKQRLRERIEREEAEKMRQVAKQQDAERHRIKEKQRREEQERADPPPLRPKVLDLDSVLREDQRPKASSHHGDPATRWKQPSPRTDEPYKPVILDIDSFTSQTRHSPSKEVFPFAGIQDAGAGAKSLPLTPERGSKAAPEALAVRRTPSSQDPWELRPGEMSVDRPAAAPEPPRKPANKPSLDQLLLKHEERHQAPERRWPALADEPPHATACLRTDTSRAGSPGRAPYSNSTPMELVWAPKESEPKGRSGNARGQRRSQGSQELNRMRSRSVSRRSMPAESAVEGNLSRMRSRSAHRERDQQSWVQQKQSGSGEDEGKDTETLVHETDSQYGTWETGLHTDDSLTPATPSSDGNLSPSPRKSTPPQTPEDPAPSIDTDTPDGLSPLSPSEIEPLSFPEVPATLLDTSALRSRAQLGKKRAPRSRPSRAARQNTALTVLPEGQAGATEDWRYRDSTEEKVENKQEDSDSEEQARGADSRSAASSQPQRIALFPGMDPSALKAQLKKRGESDCQLDGPSPSQLSRSPKSPFLPRAARVLPPSGGKENGSLIKRKSMFSEEESPKWLRELKSKKRLSQYENDS